MKWEKLEVNCVGGPGKRWGHTCNAVNGGRLIYVFGGYGRDSCQTNQVNVFDTATRTWSEPSIRGILPAPRDSHSCTTVGEKLYVFGGTDGKNPLKDLHILDTSTNTWFSPNVRGEGPPARDGHSAALVGKRIFIFGGCGKTSNHQREEYFNDLYILDTEEMTWRRAETLGLPPAKRESHTCSSWRNKLIVIGGEDISNNYLSSIHILDTDSLLWSRLETPGQALPPRAGHTAVVLDKNLFIFGGFNDEKNLYDDIHMLDLVTYEWTKVMATGEGPSARFSMAGDSLHPQLGGVLVFVGGCSKSLDALDDMYYLYTGLPNESGRDGRRLEKLSLRRQLKIRNQDQDVSASVSSIAPVRAEPITAYQYMSSQGSIQPCGQNSFVNNHQCNQGKQTFQGKIIERVAGGFEIETVIDGKLLRGVLLSEKQSNKRADSDAAVVVQMEQPNTEMHTASASGVGNPAAAPHATQKGAGDTSDTPQPRTDVTEATRSSVANHTVTSMPNQSHVSL